MADGIHERLADSGRADGAELPLSEATPTSEIGSDAAPRGGP